MNGRIDTEDQAYPQTNFFQACRGVFEGGGCRGAAHVGAYEAALRCGINFSEVAGTSAGSMVAAFIGAGATPEFLISTIARQRFTDFLSEPEGRITSSALVRIIGHLLRGRFDVLGRIMRRGSAYSSEYLQTWVDDRLAEILPHDTPRPILFKDLVLPTWVVATDLAGKRPKVWSTEDTPEESVALAVRCSCSIPLFFEPVPMGNDLFVDGGMLSNLPSFVFANPPKTQTALGGHILAFQLEGHDKARTGWSIDWLIQRLIDAAISGATLVQQSVQRGITRVRIPSGDISSTNFRIQDREIDFLLASGRRAVIDLIRNEHEYISAGTPADIVRYGEDEMFDDVVQEMSIPGDRLAVACTDTEWFWYLFPSVIHWIFAGARVDVLMEKRELKPSEEQRQEMLKKLGANIVEVQRLPFAGYLLERRDERHNAAFILSRDKGTYALFATVYIGAKHYAMISSLLRSFSEAAKWPAAAAINPSLRKADAQDMIGMLKRGVNQYTDDCVTLELKSVSLNGTDTTVQMVVRRVRSYKYRQIPHLIALYAKFGLTFCEPADIVVDGQTVSKIVPPVMEKWGDALVTIEGNTRVYYLDRNKGESVVALVASGVRSPLPGRPVAPSAALLTTYDLKINERIMAFDYNNFRAIERAARPKK